MKLFSVSGQHRSNSLLRYAPENRSSPKVVARKWLLHIKKYKKSHEIRLIRPQTQHKNPECMSLNS
jgi:hypothetical protein